MASEEIKYKRLPGTKRGIFHGASLWMGDDHLLAVSGWRFTEDYKRYYYRDIQALVVTRDRRLVVTLPELLAVVAFGITALIAKLTSIEWLAEGCLALLVLLALYLLIVSLTQSCRCRRAGWRRFRRIRRRCPRGRPILRWPQRPWSRRPRRRAAELRCGNWRCTAAWRWAASASRASTASPASRFVRPLFWATRSTNSCFVTCSPPHRHRIYLQTLTGERLSLNHAGLRHFLLVE